MKELYKPIRFLLFILCLATALKAQTPCSGTPGANTIIPQTHTICAGSIASMSLASSYTTTGITYQWLYSNVSSVGPFSPIAGATLSTYSSGTLTPGNVYYQLVITCTNDNSTLSIPHTVSVYTCNIPCSGAPATTSILPGTQTLCAGQAASLSLSNNYMSQGITYQWGGAFSPGGPFSSIPNATLSSYTSPTLAPGNIYYNVVVTCTNSGLSYSTSAAVSVSSCTYCSGVPGSNTVLPVSQVICAGSAASMSLANTYTGSGITYQWQSSTVSGAGPFTPISGATSSAYTSGPLNSTTYYNVVITCTNSGLSISVPHEVTVVSCNSPCSGTPATNTILPATHTLCAGDVASMGLANTYTNTGLVYQWQTSASPSGPFTAIPGATLSTYTSPALLANTWYNLVVTCTNSSLSHTITHAVSVVSCTYCSGTPAPNSIIPPANYTICYGTAASMSLTGTYTASGITYQWQQSPVSISGPYTSISGATLNAHTTPTLGMNMFYNVIITCTNSGASISVARAVSVFTCTDTGLSEALFQAFQPAVYPNPNTGEFTITSGLPVKAALLLTDLTGRVLFTGQYTGTDTKIDISALPEGVYYLQLRSDSGTRVVKVFKE